MNSLDRWWGCAWHSGDEALSATSWVPLEGNRGHIKIGNMALKNAPDIDGNIPLPAVLQGVQLELPQLLPMIKTLHSIDAT